MYHIHTTEGVIVRSTNYGEANKIVHIFTKDFGLVVAIAQGVRYEKSKLRYGLRDYCFGKFSLIRGKDFWRIIGIEELILPYYTDNIEKYQILARISSIIFRLVQGEGGHQEIYTCLLNFANFELDHNFNKDMILATESLLVVRILHRLGYVGKNNQFDKEIIGLEFNKEDILSINTKRQEINRSINLALRESHL